MNISIWEKILYRKHLSDNQNIPPVSLLPLALLLTLSYGFVVVRTAWLNDDAYITFRVVENFAQGYGLTWNPGERVQVSTHPLWLGLLILAQWMSGEVYYSSLGVSLGLAVMGVFVSVGRLARTTAVSLLAALILTLSKAYIDYSTSGLENPLTHLLLIYFFYYYWHHPTTDPPRLLPLTFLFSLTLLTRTDLLLLLGPPLALAWWPRRTWRHWPWLLLGLLPLIAWELFSLVYYGFPFPNTAYAKAFNTGIPAAALVAQGWRYLANSWHWDPLTLTIIAAGTLPAITTRQRSVLAATGGLLLYLAYVVRIGGDFMSGRFLTAPLLTAVLLLIHFPPPILTRWWAVLGTTIAIIWLGWQANFPTLLSQGDYGTLPSHQENGRDADIADERLFYYPHTGLLSQHLPHPWIEQAKLARAAAQPLVERGNIGLFGYYVGPQTYVLDHYALSDALLARLPIDDPTNWRIGHLRRTPPPGYLQTLQSGQNQLTDPQLARYYDHLRLIIRGDLWNWPRFQAIWRINTGQYNTLLPH